MEKKLYDSNKSVWAFLHKKKVHEEWFDVNNVYKYDSHSRKKGIVIEGWKFFKNIKILCTNSGEYCFIKNGYFQFYISNVIRTLRNIPETS